MASPVIIGDPTDDHVNAVASLLGKTKPVILDVESLALSSYMWTVDHPFALGNEEVGSHGSDVGRGWIRRLAPPGWQRGTLVGSHDSAASAAWMSLLVAVMRTSGVQWLTEVDPLVTTENKLLQAATAKQCGVDYPLTLVSDNPEVLANRFGDTFIIKPLGPSNFVEGDRAWVVFATQVNADSAVLRTIDSLPVVAQEVLEAVRHYRVVTVGHQVWGAALDARGLPRDWRSSQRSHRDFREAVLPQEVESGALRVAKRLSLGYSSQDWLESDCRCVLLDVNPAGQWLFLPEQIASAVSAAIANWLRGNLDA